MKRFNWIILILISLLMIFILTVGCTENNRAKNWGGNATLNLPANQKLVNVTWKDNALWYLTKPMTQNDSAMTYTFSEESSWV